MSRSTIYFDYNLIGCQLLVICCKLNNMIRFPKNNREYHWTSHIKGKMVFYQISEQKIKTILKTPSRKEIGIAPDTSAFMKRNDTPRRKEEMWVMFCAGLPASGGAKGGQGGASSKLKVKSQKVMVSAWRYPGISKAGEAIPVPEDIMAELRDQNTWLGRVSE